MIVVLDVGKTVSKLTLWTEQGQLVQKQTRQNARVETAQYSALDVFGIEDWLAATLTDFAKLGRIEAIIPVAHGAAAVLVKDGRLALLPMDYEASPPDAISNNYEQQRAPFSETGSPSLPNGLNLGCQLYWQEKAFPEAFEGATILLWPQYWAWLLTGCAAAEVTSLGCHTDLWCPATQDFSRLAKNRGWDAMFPTIRAADDSLGYISADWAARTGLPNDVVVHCGLHDSNAALVAALAHREVTAGQTTVLSTGTWFIAMRTAGKNTARTLANVMPERRDCLFNIDYRGNPTPTARLMGGREIELLVGETFRALDVSEDQADLVAAVSEVIAGDIMVFPTFAPGCGPVPTGQGTWHNGPDDWTHRRAAIGLYAALVTAISLELIGAEGSLLVEGRFASADVFTRAMARLRPDLSVYACDRETDVSFGALHLLQPNLRPNGTLRRVIPLAEDISAYAAAWRQAVARQQKGQETGREASAG